MLVSVLTALNQALLLHPNTNVRVSESKPCILCGTTRSGKVFNRGEMVVDCYHGGMVLNELAVFQLLMTYYGEIKVNFMIVADRPMAYSLYHGDVDVTFPSSSNLMCRSQSEHGDILKILKWT